MLEGFIFFLIKCAHRWFNHFKTEQLIIGVYNIIQYLYWNSLIFVSTVMVNGKEYIFPINVKLGILVFTGASQRLEPVIKCCSFLSFFQCLVSRAPLSAVTENFTWGNRRHSRQYKDYNFWRNENFHNLYERLLYERKLKSGYLERSIYERPLHLRVSLLSRMKANILQNYLYINLL